MDLPNNLRLALAAALADIPARDLAAATAVLSQRYRDVRSGGVAGPMLRSEGEVAAYAAYRLPATLATVGAALQYVRRRRPGWAPRTLLDAGAGPGTAAWAAAEVWPDLQGMTLLERDERMIRLGQRLASQSSSPALRDAHWRRADLTGAWEQESTGTPASYELVVASYTLGEVPPERRDDVVDRFWAATGAGTHTSVGADTAADDAVLLIVEPGTPAGFAVVREARTRVIAAGGTVVAPCPHDRACPLASGDWCHFSRRVTRTRAHMQAKGVSIGYEDEKYSYVALARPPGTHSAIAGRVLRHPQTRPGHVILELCAPLGLEKTTVTRKERERYHQARDLSWGDSL